MKKSFIAILLLAALALCLLAGCEDKSSALTQEQAQKIALEELGVDEAAAQIHVHITTYEDKPCYSIHVTVGAESHEVVIDAATGEVLHIGEASH